MNEPIFKIDGEEVVYPSNIQELSYEVNFDSDLPEVSVNISEFEFFQEHKEKLNEWRENFFFEGLPASLDVGGENNPEDLLEFLLAVKDADPITCYSEVVPVLDLITTIKQNRNFTFEYLYENFPDFQPAEFVFADVPYCKNAPQDVEIFLALISTAFLIIEIENLVDELIDKIVNASSYEWGEWIASIPFFIKGVTVSLASIQILEQLYNLLVQPVKYTKAMKLKNMLIVGYQFLGYDFQSDIFTDEPILEKLYIVPKKRQIPFNENQSFNLIFDLVGVDLNVLKGFFSPDDDQTAYLERTFDQLITDLKEGWNLKEVLDGFNEDGSPVIRLEKRNWKKAQDKVILDPVEIEEFTYNSDEFISNYGVRMLVDSTDINTLQNYRGTEFKEFIYPSSDGINDKRNILGGQSVDKVISFARGSRKTELNKSEQILDRLFESAQPLINEFVFQHNVKLKQAVAIASTFVNLVNAIVDAVNTLPLINVQGIFLFGALEPFREVPLLTVPNFKNLISDRIGMLMIEKDEFEVDKMILLDEGYTYEPEQPTQSNFLIGNIFVPFVAPSAGLFTGSGRVTLTNGESPRINRLNDLNEEVVNAFWFWKKFHSYESFVPNIEGETDWANGDHNQHIKYDAQQFILKIPEFRKLKRSNFVTWCEKDGEFFSNLTFNPFNLNAEGRFKVKQIYYDKLISTKTIPNGSTRTKNFQQS